MGRWALCAVMLIAGLAAPSPASAAEDWRATGWYGWITYHRVLTHTGADSLPQAVDQRVRIRVEGSRARVIEASGTSWAVQGGPSCHTTTTWETLGPGAPQPFGDVFEVTGDGTETGYHLSAYVMSVRQQVTSGSSPAGCAAPQDFVTDSSTDVEVGCGPMDFETGSPAPCAAADTTRLTESRTFTLELTEDTTTYDAAWDLASDPDEDPCLALPDRCLDEGGPQVEVSETGQAGDLGVACGAASFQWRAVTGRRRSVKDGEHACVFLVGNDVSRTLLKVSVEEGVPIGSAFAGTLLGDGVVGFGDSAAPWGEEQRSSRLVMGALAKALGASSARLTAVSSVGQLVGLMALPLAGAFIHSQVKKKNACVQVIVDQDGSDLKVDWSMVYARTDEASLTRAKVYRKVDRRRRIDTYEPVSLGMQCLPSGEVSVSGSRSAAMRPRTTTYFRTL